MVTTTADSGPGSLRQVIADAVSGETIAFATGLAGQTIALSSAGDTSLGSSALLVNKTLIIVGPTGSSGITIARTGSTEMRLFRVTSSGNLTLRNLTLSEGLIRGDAGQSADGGGGGGGGGLGGAILNEGTLALEGSTLTNNRAIGGAGGNGGLTLSGAPGGGRGGGANGGAGANGFPGNGSTGGFGGGGGGGDNTAGFFDGSYGGAGGIGGGGGGGGATQGGPGGRGSFAPITGALGGSDRGGGGGGLGLGGAVFNRSGAVTITNCTLSANSVEGGAGGVSESGGTAGAAGAGVGAAVFNYNGTLAIVNATVAANSGSAIYNLGDGGTGTVSLTNTLLSNSPHVDYGHQAFNGGALSSSGKNNLVRSNGGFSGGIVSSADPLLSSLQSNGGPTATHALPLNSPAVDAGADDVAITVDQRGSARRSRAHVDIGAYELQNVAPSAAAQSMNTNQATALQITLAGSDPEGDSVTYAITTHPAHGTLSAVNGSSVTYTPAAGYYGSDSFGFKAVDAYGADSSPATVSIAINGAPTAAAQSVLTNQDTAKLITLTASDPEGDSYTFSVVTNPAHGTLSAIDGTQVTYTPAAGYHGSDSVTFRAADAKGAAGTTATVSITVNGAPVAVNQSAGLVRGTSKTLTLGAIDPEGDARSFSIVSPPTHGTLSAVSGNQVTYTASTVYEGSDSFSFRATDSKGAVGPAASVTLTIVSPLIVTSAGDGTVADEFVTLREAIAFAQTNAGADNITFNLPGAGPHVINLASGLTISTDMTIEAPAGQPVTVQPDRADGAFLIVRITAGVVTFTRLTILSAPGGSFSTPGASGIYNTGTLTLRECTFSNHRSQHGAIRNDATLTLSDCTFSNNTSAFGAAIYSGGTLDATRCLFSGNTSSGAGGALTLAGVVTLTDSTFIDNVATNSNGGAISSNANTTLRNCTFLNNRAPAFHGGAVHNVPGGTLWVINSTFNGNSGDRGGAIDNRGTLHLRSSTITGNSTTASGIGGGMYDLGTATLQNTVIAGNTANGEPDISVSFATTSLGHNFIGRRSHSDIFTGPGDQQGSNAAPLDAKLGALADNGGYTQTIAPLPNSPLVDKGKRSSDVAGGLISSDQRGAARPVDLGGVANAAGGDGTDIGAVELPASAFPTASDQTVTTAEDTAKSISLTGSAPGGGALTYQIVTVPAHGTLSTVAGDQVTYTPAADYNGSDSFTFRAVSASGASSHNVGTVSITITPTPDAPVAANQSVVAAFNSTISITLGASDADGDSLAFAIVTGPAQGTLGAVSGNQVSYTPASGYSGPDSFTFKANDGSADSNIATVSITIADPPSLVVTMLSDTINHNDGQTSLREAIAYASTLSGSPAITFAPSVNGTIVLGSTLAISNDMTITGPGANLLAISGNNAVRVFSVAAGRTVNLSGVTIANGRLTANGQSGAGISNAGTLNVSACAFTGNRVHGIADAGAVHNNGGALTVTNSTFVSNHAAFGGGGVRNESGTATLTNCTFVGNLAGSGGAVQHINGTLTLRFCTLTGNTSYNSAGGGVQSQNGHTLRLNHTIVSGNEGGDTSGTITDDGFNLIGGSAALDTLKDNGGPVQTVALLRNSPALDAGAPAFASPPETDARGAGFPRKLGQRVDIGAFESVAAPLAGRSGSALRFDGVDDYVELPDDLFPYPSPTGPSEPISFEAFFKTTSGGVILGQQTHEPFNDAQNGWVPAVYVGTNGKLHVVMFNHNADPAVMQSSATVNDGAWHHVAVTYDGTSERFYLDGALQGSRNVAQVGYSEHYRYQLGTGRTTYWPNDNGTWYPFNGMLDEVRIWNRARTSTEIASSWNKSLGGGEAGLLAYYRFDEANGTTAVDHSGNGNAGTLRNGVERQMMALLSGDYINDGWTTTLRNTPIGGTLVAFDAANSPLTFSKLADPSHGSVIVNGDGSFTYTPASGYTGPDSFSFRASTSARFSNDATFTIDVAAPPNAAPIANADAVDRYPHRSASVAEATLLANDSDSDGNLPLTIVSVSAPASGQATVTRGTGYVFYDPNPDFTGADSFTYTISDALGATSTATVTVNIATGTPPSNLPSILLETVAAGRQSRIAFTGVPGRTYRVQFTDRLEPELANWQTLQTVAADAAGQFEIIDPPPLPPQRFYRVVYP